MKSSVYRSSTTSASYKVELYRFSSLKRGLLSSRSRFKQKEEKNSRYMLSWFGYRAVDSETSETSMAAPSGAATVQPDFRIREVSANNGFILYLKTACCYLPHPDKISYGGEDAHFISSVGGGACGVADGVGGWQESGVNPADYSRGLMHVASMYLEGTGPFSQEQRPPGPLIDPRGALHAAHMRTRVAGSATACVMQLDQARRMLVAANLGDSGFIVVRGGKVIAKSKPLQHYFDCPLQFGCYPDYVEATDTADMADLYRVPLQPGDIVVAGSDGLWDNAFEHEIIEAVTTNADAQQAANKLAALARVHASDPEFASPYTREALSQGLDLPWWEKLFGASFKNGRFQLRQLTGGKQDDITVIVSQVHAEASDALQVEQCAPNLGGASDFNPK
ncbi:hypothetical protein CEUSTIGMA_g1031.t1 [Chlamydomonas eustigma]|uniref:Protein phosphatase n=1 Tax=Chlamydomonas eustigma TaxID=1157962 RepID=A0A250WSS1_9CHLO|nr:hypothetical protein CEUSTIGMA_g1031.t1 [Chlamydomonas eustigma]|eukprot:GAX73580.1 hypothetical protein CEUSTIGMA_g1031.t1 [Chlamydomonas eustigma]